MTSSTRSGRILKDEGTSISRAAAKVKNIKDSVTSGATTTGRKNKTNNSIAKDTKSPASSGSVAANSPSLRKTYRETSTKKTSPKSRKSGRLECQAPQSPPDKKVEKKRPRSPLRRSERIEKNGTSSFPVLKKVKVSSSPAVRKEDNKKEKIAVEITDNQSKDKKLNSKSSAIRKKKGGLNAHRYRALLQPKKNDSSDDDGVALKDSSASKENSSNSATRDSKRVNESIDECNGRKRGKIQGEYLDGDSKEADEGSASGSRELAGTTLGNLIPRKSARLCGKQNFEDKTPVSKCSDSSLQQSEFVLTVKENDGRDSGKKINIEDNSHDAHKLDIEKPELSGMIDSSSEVKSLAVDKSMESEVQAGDLKSTEVVADLDSDISVSVVQKDICYPENFTAGITSASPCGSKNKDMKICTICNKLDRVLNSSDSQDLCVCNVQREFKSLPAVVEVPNELVSNSYESETPMSCSPKNKVKVNPLREASQSSPGSERGTSGASDNVCMSEGQPSATPQRESSVAVLKDGATNACVVCKHPGQLLCCDGKGCKRNYHLSCLNPPLQDVPPGAWFCLFCVKKKLELGVYSVAEGLESIWDVKEGMQNGKLYFVKYKGLAHIHDRWIPESEMHLEAPMLVAKYDKRRQKEKVTRRKQEWTEPCRLLEKRLLMPKNIADEYFCRLGDKISNCYNEWLVKWKGLGYENATWELENSPFLCSPEAKVLVSDFESRREEAKRRSDPCRVEKVLLVKKSPFQKLTRLPDDCPVGLDNDHLTSVNRLLEFWHKSQNAIFVDDQERIIKSVLFVSALKAYTCQPILVISNAASLSLWEIELIRLAPSINVVVYNGSKNIRKMIRTLEFYEEGGCLMFQVLLSHPDAIIEDFEVLEHVSWEALIIDECQNPRISKHLEHFKKLSTEFKLLLLFSGQIKDSLAEYLNLLSFLEPGGKESSGNSSKYGTNESAGTLAILKEKLARYLAYERKPDSSKFLEYWVPVRLSNVQLEQYCSTIVSNSIALRSCQKVDQVGVLRDILISTRKCCDHPYLVGPSLQGSLTKDLPLDMYLDVGIKSSGKLHLLDKFLHELKKKGLRLLILFQSIGGAGRDSIGDILDDFLRQRFGADSYERVDSGLVMSKKLAAMNMFNDKANGRFVFLIENRACLPSIKLSSVDAVVIFNSDWNPLNDIKALQRVHIESQHVKVYRLYSSYTVEEKVLIFAKQDLILESNIQNITPNNSHMLLSWGAFHLFNELEEFHQHENLNNYSKNPTDECLINSSMLKFLNDVLLELLKQEPKDVENNIGQCALMIKAQQSGASYSRTISLVGERDGISSLDRDPPTFWSNLLENRHPKWKFISESSQRVRKKVQHCESLRVPEEENDELRRKRKTMSTNTVDPISLQTWFEDKRKGLGKDAKVLDDVSPHRLGRPGPILRATVPIGLPKEPETHGSEGNKRSNYTPSSAVNMNHTTPGFQVSSLSDDIEELHKFSMVESDGRRNAQRNLHLVLKPELSQLCDTLKLPEDVKDLAHMLLEYVMNNHHVSRDPETILQAFKLSLCWRAASFLKYKVDHRECLALSKKYLNYSCNEEQAGSVYSKLRMLKKVFSQTNQLRHKKEPNSLENQSSGLRNAEASEPCDRQEVREVKEVSGCPSSSGELFEEQEQASLGNPSKVQQDLGSLKDVLLKKQLDLIDMICSKREDALLLNQREELSHFNVQREEEKLMLKSAHDVQLDLIRSIHTDCTVRNEKAKLLNQDFSKKMTEYDQHMKCQRQKLAFMQENAKNKERSIRNGWMEDAKAGILANSFDTLPLTESGFRMEKFGDSNEQVEVCNGSIMNVSLPASDLFSNDMAATVPVACMGTTASISSNGRLEPVESRASLSTTLPEGESLQPNGTTAEILPAVFPNMIKEASTEPIETSAVIPASILPEEDGNMLQDKGTPFSESRNFKVSNDQPDETPSVPTVETTALPLASEPNGTCTEVPATQLGDMCKETETPPSQCDIVIDAGNASNGRIIDTTIGTTEAATDRNPCEGDDNTEVTCLIPSSVQSPADLPSAFSVSPECGCESSLPSNLVPSSRDHNTLAVSIGSGCNETLKSPQQISVSSGTPVDPAPSQNGPTGQHISTSNPTLPQASPSVLHPPENSQVRTYKTIGGDGDTCADSRELSGLPTGLSMQQLIICTDRQAEEANPLSSQSVPASHAEGICSTSENVQSMQEQINQLGRESIVHALPQAETSKIPTKLPMQQRVLTADGQVKQSNPLTSQPVPESQAEGICCSTSGNGQSMQEQTNHLGTESIVHPLPQAETLNFAQTELPLQQPIEQAELSNPLSSHSVPASHADGICCSTSGNGQSMQEPINQLGTGSIVQSLPQVETSEIAQTELSVQHPFLTANVTQTAHSNQMASESTQHPLPQAEENIETPVQLQSVPATVQSHQYNQLVSDSVANLLPERIHTEVHGSTANSQEPGSHSIQIFPLAHWVHPQALHPDPLQNELFRIRKQDELRTKMHEDKKLQLKVECEQEIEKIRRKYDVLLKDAESGFHQDKKILDTIYNKVLVNQILAQEFRAKFVESKAGTVASVQGRSSSSAMQQQQQQHPQTSQPLHNTARPSSTAAPVSIPLSANRPQVPSPRLPSSSSLPLAHGPACPVTSGPSARPAPPPILPKNPIRSQFSPMLPPHPNAQAGSGARPPASRAPAPHLHRFRPPTSMMAPIPPPQSILGTMSLSATIPPLHPSRLPLGSGGTTNQPPPSASQVPLAHGTSTTVPLPVTSAAADIVCLSDDE